MTGTALLKKPWFERFWAYDILRYRPKGYNFTNARTVK